MNEDAFADNKYYIRTKDAFAMKTARASFHAFSV